MKTRNRTYLFSSAQHNQYFHNGNIAKTLLCHPVLAHLIGLARDGVPLDKWVRRQPRRGIEIAGSGHFTRGEVQYYYRKYLLLMEGGFFDGAPPKGRFMAEISPDSVRRTLSDLNQVVFEVTDGCNLECTYCGYGKFYEDYDRREGKKLDPDAARRLIDYLAGFWNSNPGRYHRRRVNIGFYGGEPLLNFPFIRQMVEHVGRLKLPRRCFGFSMTTNALLLEKHMDFLAAHDFDLLLSLDGDAAHNSYRIFRDGRESHELVCRNIKALQARHPEYFRKRVFFNAVFHNRSNIAGIHRFFKANFGKMPRLRELNPYGIRDSQRAEFWRTYSDTATCLAQIDDCGAIVRDFFVNLPPISSVSKFIQGHNDSCFRNYNEMLVARTDMKRYPSGTCLPLWSKVYMTVNNKLMACEKIGHEYAFGRVTNRGVELDFDGIAANYNACFGRLARLCRRCHLADNCSVCVFYQKMDPRKSTCPSFMNARDFEEHFASYMSYLEYHPRQCSRILEDIYHE